MLPVGAVLGSDLGFKAIRLTVFVTSLTALTLAFALVLGDLLNDLQRDLPPEFALGLGLMPFNAPACVSAMLVAAAGRWVYDVQTRLMSRAMQ